ncbi:MAG: MFS transporter [Dehalococcoidia bacterium]|nr:MFS transporter [Dehalococcoidia bacterium]
MSPAVVRRNTLLFYSYGFLMSSGLWLGIWIKYLVDERGLELRWILAMDMPFWLVVALLQAPTGALADHIGRRRVLMLAGLLYGLTIFGFGLTTNYVMLFADYMLWAVAMSMQSGADQALVYDTLKLAGEEGRYQKVAGRGFASALVAGFGGVLLGGVVADATSLAFTVQVSALFPLLAVPVAFAMREPPRVEHAERRYWQGLRDGFSFAWTTPQVRYTVLISACLMTAVFGPVVLVQPFLLHHNVETAYFGVFQAPLRLVSVAAALVAFRVGARTGVGPLLVVAFAAVVASYLGLAAVDETSVFVLFALPALVQGLTRPVVDAHLNTRIPSERRATVLSLSQLVFSLQVALFEPALGFLTDDVSLTAAFLFAAAYFILAMPPLLLLWRRAHAPGPLAEPLPALESAPGG